MRMLIKQYSSLAVITLSMVLLSGCQGDGDAAEVNSTLVINPVSLEAATPEIVGCSYQDQMVIISANRADGSPLGETDLFMTLEYAGNTQVDGIRPFMSLYADTGNLPGVVDPNDELVSEANDPGYSTTTNSEGIKRMLIRMEVGCVGYEGTFEVYGSGGRIYGQSDISVTVNPAVDTDSDGVADFEDNCPDDANPNQDDIDGDGIGDVCDV